MAVEATPSLPPFHSSRTNWIRLAPRHYKMTLDGKLLGWGQSGLGHGQSGCLVHELHCESETVVYKGDCSTWTVSKMTIKGGSTSSQ